MSPHLPPTEYLVDRPGRSLRRSKPQRFRSAEALAAKPLFTNLQWGPPAASDSFRRCENASILGSTATLSSGSRADARAAPSASVARAPPPPRPLHTRSRSSAAAQACRDAIVVRGGALRAATGVHGGRRLREVTARSPASVRGVGGATPRRTRPLDSEGSHRRGRLFRHAGRARDAARQGRGGARRPCARRGAMDRLERQIGSVEDEGGSGVTTAVQKERRPSRPSGGSIRGSLQSRSAAGAAAATNPASGRPRALARPGEARERTPPPPPAPSGRGRDDTRISRGEYAKAVVGRAPGRGLTVDAVGAELRSAGCGCGEDSELALC